MLWGPRPTEYTVRTPQLQLAGRAIYYTNQMPDTREKKTFKALKTFHVHPLPKPFNSTLWSQTAFQLVTNSWFTSTSFSDWAKSESTRDEDEEEEEKLQECLLWSFWFVSVHERSLSEFTVCRRTSSLWWSTETVQKWVVSVKGTVQHLSVGVGLSPLMSVHEIWSYSCLA